MASETDIKLRSHLDSNQRDREQMCRAILNIHPNYTDVKPRHPLGGPDGGRDLEAVDLKGRLVFGAVGFKNGANDSKAQIDSIKAKFEDDAKSALNNEPKPKVFVFLTNVKLTMKEQENLNKMARAIGFEKSDILDRERIRIELDDARGLFARFQYLNIPLSPAEQASFLSKFGDTIQSVLSTGFSDVQKSLRRLLFLKEAERVLDTIFVSFNLDREYAGKELGHCRAFAQIMLKEVKHNIFCIYFGTSDRSDRFMSENKRNFRDQVPGLHNSQSGGQWECDLINREDIHSDEPETWHMSGSSAMSGIEKMDKILAKYRHDDSLLRFRPKLKLMDLDQAHLLMKVNESLADKIDSIEVYANGYRILDKLPISISSPNKEDNNYPGDWTEEELSDQWKKITPSKASFFQVDFFNRIPFRSFDYKENEN